MALAVLKSVRSLSKTIVCFHIVAKIQTKKLSILPRFYFHDALEQLKTNCQTNFRFKRGSWFCDRVRLNF